MKIIKYIMLSLTLVGMQQAQSANDWHEIRQLVKSKVQEHSSPQGFAQWFKPFKKPFNLPRFKPYTCCITSYPIDELLTQEERGFESLLKKMSVNFEQSKRHCCSGSQRIRILYLTDQLGKHLIEKGSSNPSMHADSLCKLVTAKIDRKHQKLCDQLGGTIDKKIEQILQVTNGDMPQDTPTFLDMVDQVIAIAQDMPFNLFVSRIESERLRHTLCMMRFLAYNPQLAE